MTTIDATKIFPGSKIPQGLISTITQALIETCSIVKDDPDCVVVRGYSASQEFPGGPVTLNCKGPSASFDNGHYLYHIIKSTINSAK